MKPKETQSQEDILEQMKAAWQEQCRRADQMPWLSDETLEQLYAKYSKEHGEVPPPTGLHHPSWAQMLTALIGLGTMVYSVVLCHRMWDDIYMRLLLCGVAAASLFIIVQSLFPDTSPLFRLFCREHLGTASASLPTPRTGYALRRLLPYGLASLVILLIASRLPLGDGYYITMEHPDRLWAAYNVNFMITNIG
ncbi:MAG: hypothetical protein IKH97_03690 [Bacteroidales bacterium]|nr:hypothetical protein [Bacteroidales bacterium]